MLVELEGKKDVKICQALEEREKRKRKLVSPNLEESWKKKIGPMLSFSSRKKELKIGQALEEEERVAGLRWKGW